MAIGRTDQQVAVSHPVAPTTVPVRGSARPAGRVVRFVEAYALAALLMAVLVFFSVYPATSSTFPTLANLQVVLGTQSVLAIAALGALIPLIAKQWDLSVGAVAGLSAVLAAKALSLGLPTMLALGLSLLIGLGVGTLTALLVTRVGTNAVITTLGVAGLAAGAVNQVTGGNAQVSNIPMALTAFGSGTWLGIPRLAWLLAGTAVAVGYILGHTPFGRYIYAFGSNEEAARLVGLRTKVILGTTFMAAGALAGLAGFLQVARAGGADPRVGDSLLLPALAAAFLSTAAIKPGRYNVGGMLVAMFLLAFLNSGLNLAGAPPYISQYVNGAALIAGVALTVSLGKRTRSKAG